MQLSFLRNWPYGIAYNTLDFHFNFPHLNWSNLESDDKSNEQFLDLIQDCYLTQHVLNPIRGSNVLDLFLTSESSMVDTVSENILQRRIIMY